jgi:hypothetical protein
MVRLQIRIVCHRGLVGYVAAGGGLVGISQRFARLNRA